MTLVRTCVTLVQSGVFQFEVSLNFLGNSSPAELLLPDAPALHTTRKRWLSACVATRSSRT